MKSRFIVPALLVLIVLLTSSVVGLSISISGNPAKGVGESSARIEWNTDVDSTSRVDYGTSPALGLIKEELVFSKFHQVKLEGLQANTKYYFRIMSIAQTGDSKINDNGGNFFTFTTSPSADFLPPTISGIIVTNFGETSTTFAWNTSEDADTQFFYGESEPLQKISDPALLSTHVVTIPTASGKIITVVPAACDAYDNCLNGTGFDFLAGVQTGLPPLTADVPSVVREDRIDITGTTRPLATVTVYVNNLKQKSILAEGNGSFTFTNVILSASTNTVKLSVRDVAGNLVEQSYPVAIDSKPPQFILNLIPEIVASSPITLTGTANEHVTVVYEVKESFDSEKPARVTGARGVKVEANSVKIAWNQNKEEDIHEYAIYRSGVRVATTSATEYVDSVSSGQTYTYRISAVDTSCNEGALSDSLFVQTPNGGFAINGETTEAPFTCVSDVRTVEADGPFSIGVDLVDGDNEIRIDVTDDAGNELHFVKNVRLDNTPPQFLEDNLDRISPAYIPEVTVKGKVSEKATVFVYVNGESKPQDFTVTDDDGTFSIKVKLKKDLSTTSLPGSSGAGIPTGNVVLEAGTGGSENTIKLEAVDLAGLKTTKGPSKVVYALCGDGSLFKVDVGEISPATISPRLIIEGVAQIGFPVNISYRGAHKAVIKGLPTVSPVILSGVDAEKFDSDKVEVTWLGNRNKPDIGYVQITYRAQPPAEGQTTSDKEDEISDWHKEDCVTPGIGCTRLFLQLEINGQEELPKSYLDIRQDTTTGNVTVENIRQKVCMPIEVVMDQPIHLSKKIPKKFLTETSGVLQDVIDVIDIVLKPLTTIGTYTTYLCFAMTGWYYVLQVDEVFTCDVEPILGILGGAEGNFKREVAEIGACDEVYPKDSKSETNKNCNECQDIIDTRKGHEYNLGLVCDRVSCPSAPTLQTYIKDAQGSDVRQVGVSTKGENLYAGNSCGFTGDEQISSTVGVAAGVISIVPGASAASGAIVQGNTASRIEPTYASVKQQYFNYLKHKDDDSDAKKSGQVNCDGLHPANPECCGSEYYTQWGSACGIPGIVETFNEIKESACLGAQQANSVPQFEQEAAAHGESISCNNLINAVAGFCEKGTGQPKNEVLGTNTFYTTLPQGAKNREVYVSIEPVPREDPKEFKIQRGFIKQGYSIASGDSASQQGEFEVNAKLNFHPDKDLTANFRGDQNVVQENVKNFANDFCSGLDSGCFGKAKGVYDDIKSRTTISDKTYIVRPEAEGIIRSAQCVCLPAVTSYLQYWRTVLANVKTCVDHVRLTGEGSSGVCKAVLSTYVCDLLYDVLRCFIQKFSIGGVGTRVGSGGLGDVIGGLTKAGSNVQGYVQGRYGETALWKTMFNDKKLLHGICAFAFTGQWDLDINGLFKQTVDSIPIESQGLIVPATRSFTGYSTITKPKGLTTWIYHFGVGIVAGADLRYQLTLKCSNGFDCETRDGFVDGKCDCFGKSEQQLPISTSDLSGTLSKNDVLNTEVYWTMQAGASGSEVRYDKAILSWEYTDSTGKVIKDQVEQKIHLSGSDAPNFCKVQLIGTPYYLCNFGIGDYAGARFAVDPTLKSPGVLLLNKQGDFTTDVELLGSTDARDQNLATADQNTKFLVYELKNSIGTIVSDNRDNPVKIDTPGTKSYTMQTRTIDRAAFGAVGTPQLIDNIALRDPGAAISGWNGYARGFVEKAEFVVTPKPGSSLNVLLRFTDDNGGFEVYEPTGAWLEGTYIAYNADNSKTGVWGWWKKQDLTPATTDVIAPVATGKTTDRVLTFEDEGGLNPTDAQVKLTFLPNKLPKKNAEIFINYNQLSDAGDVCARFKDAPDTWVATFTIYDGKKPIYGGQYVPNFEQIAIDAVDEQQVKRLNVQAVCSESYKGAEATTFPPNVKECDADGSVKSDACYCGTPEQAWKDFDTLKDAFKHNCGIGNELVKNNVYCAYKKDGSRVCSSIPAPSLDIKGVSEYGSKNTESVPPLELKTPAAIKLLSDKKGVHSLALFPVGEFDPLALIPFIESGESTSYTAVLSEVAAGDYLATARVDGTVSNVKSFKVTVGIDQPLVNSISIIESDLSATHSGSPYFNELYFLKFRAQNGGRPFNIQVIHNGAELSVLPPFPPYGTSIGSFTADNFYLYPFTADALNDFIVRIVDTTEASRVASKTYSINGMEHPASDFTDAER